MQKLKNDLQIKFNSLLKEYYTSTITLSVKELNSPVKGYKVADWIKNQTPLYVALKRHIIAIKTKMDSK